jgi:hypothetical protein
MLAKIENGVVTQWPLGEHFIQTANPRTSFAFPLSDKILKDFGFARFEYSDPAYYDSEFQEAKEITPVLNGVVATQAWEIVEKYTAAEKQIKIAEKAALEAKLAATAYQRQRAAEYPSIGDQLDSLFKAGVFPADMAAAIQAVKDKYPKG